MFPVWLDWGGLVGELTETNHTGPFRLAQKIRQSSGVFLGTKFNETQEYHVEGPVAIVFTTTSIGINEELMNRCLVLTVDHSLDELPPQTRSLLESTKSP